MQIGQTFSAEWNAAKTLGCTSMAYTEMRVEAVGFDWVVVRDADGDAHAATFHTEAEKQEFLKEFTPCN